MAVGARASIFALGEQLFAVDVLCHKDEGAAQRGDESSDVVRRERKSGAGHAYA